MAVGGESAQLLLGGGLLVFLLPLGVRHTVDPFTGVGVRKLKTLLAGRFRVPAAQAIAAEAGSDHQIDVLHFLVLVQVLEQAPQHRCFQVPACILVDHLIPPSAMGSGRGSILPPFVPEHFRVSIAYQGIAGAWSHLACRAVHPELEAIPCPSFEDVFEIVEAGGGDLAMIPIENNLGGRVADIHQLLPHQALHIVAEYFQAIRHELLAVPGATLEGLRAVYSHPQALAQCRRFLREQGLEPHAASDTAASAQWVAEQANPAVGAIASGLAGDLYELESVRRDIQDEFHNTTRFIVLAREKNENPAQAGTAYITALWFQLRSVPAALYKALGAFATNYVNLTKLESYIGTETFDRARFYVEIEGHEFDAPVRSALKEVKYFADVVRVLGSFAQHEFRRRADSP